MSDVAPSSDDSRTKQSVYDDTASKQRARFRALLEHSPSIIAQLDASGRFQFVSPSIEDIAGYRPEQLVGESAFEYIHPSDRERVERTFARGLEEPNRILTVEYRFRHADGHWVVIEARGHNRFDDPAVEGFVVNARDVSPERRAEARLRRERDRNRQLLEVAPHPMVIVDGDGVIRRTNEAARTQLGLGDDDLVGLHHDADAIQTFDADGEPLPASENVSAQVRERGEPVQGVTHEWLGPNGNRFRMTVSGAPLETDGEITHVVLSFEDVEPV